MTSTVGVTRERPEGYGPLSLGGLTARELGRRVWRRMYDDSAWDTAAQLGFYFMLALFPLVIFLVDLLTVLHAIDVVGPLLATLRHLMPTPAFLLLNAEIERVTAGASGSLVTVGALAAVWASSSGVEALLNMLNRAYEVRETRSYWKVRATSIVMTFAIVFMVVAGGGLLAFGDRAWARASERFDYGWLDVAATGVNYALGLFVILLGLEVVFYYGPNVANQKWRWVSPGSLVALLLFVASSRGFSLYVVHTDSYSTMYGSLGAVIIMLFWLYILGLALLTGGEINAQVAAAARAQGERDAPMVGIEAEPPKPEAAAAEAEAAAAPPIEVTPVDDPVRDLVEAIRRERGYARAALATALGARGEEASAAVPDLVAALEDEHPAVRLAAADALASLEKTAAPALAALRACAANDAEGSIRGAAERAAARIESPPPPQPGAATASEDDNLNAAAETSPPAAPAIDDAR